MKSIKNDYTKNTLENSFGRYKNSICLKVIGNIIIANKFTRIK